MLRSFREVVGEAKSQVTEVEAEEIERWRREGEPIVLLDIREGEDYQKGHIPGAISLPRGLLELKIDEVTTNPDASIVCYCGGGSRSALAALTLKQMGYSNPLSLSGGLRGWKEQGRPVEADES